jgi:hypothetical protein
MRAALIRFAAFDNALKGSHIDMRAAIRQPLAMTCTANSNGTILATSLRGWCFFVSFTGRYACGRPEIC